MNTSHPWPWNIPQGPAGVIVQPKLVVARKSGDAILEKTRTAKPTKALRRLMRDAD